MEPTSVIEPQAEPAPTPDLFDYDKAKIRINKTIDNFKCFVNAADLRRKERYINLDVKDLREKGLICEDETFIPIRVIDSNIVRDKADAMNFLNASKRLGYYRCIDDPKLDTRQLETDVTKGLTYEDWYKTYDKHYDGAALHGWDSVEVIFDTTKPLHVSHEHIGHDKLFFNTKVASIQDSEMIIREYEFTAYALEEFVTTLGFDPIVVASITQKNDSQRRDDETFKVYKQYFKFQNCVYIAWISRDVSVNSWLKAPEKLKCGIVKQQAQLPQPSIGSAMGQGILPSPTIAEPPLFTESEVTMYPIFLWTYRDDEQDSIIEHKGRGFLDLPQQEAATAMTSAYVNGSLRGSNVYVSPKNDDAENAHKLEEVVLENGTVLPVAMDFYSHPYPDPGMLQGLQFLDMTNAKQSGKMAVAVSNRKDSRKTAEELKLAGGEEQKITSTNLATYSEWLRKIYNFSWLIIQSRAIANLIPLCKKEIIPPPPAMGMPQLPQIPRMENDIELISKNFDIRAAGDIDVLQAQATIQAMKQDWPVYQNIPGLNLVFLEELIRLSYPMYAEKFIAAMKAGDQAKQIIQQLLTILQGALQPEEVAAIGPQGQSQLQMVLMQAQQYLASTPGAPPAQLPPPQQSQAA
jgi:hypothetical protein